MFYLMACVRLYGVAGIFAIFHAARLVLTYFKISSYCTNYYKNYTAITKGVGN